MPSQQPGDFQELIRALEDEFIRLRPVGEVGKKNDRAILVSVTTASRARAAESMLELEELSRSADVMVLDTVIQRRPKLNPRLIMGKGKLGEIMLQALTLDANLLLFDQELNPSQIRSITDELKPDGGPTTYRYREPDSSPWRSFFWHPGYSLSCPS